MSLKQLFRPGQTRARAEYTGTDVLGRKTAFSVAVVAVVVGLGGIVFHIARTASTISAEVNAPDALGEALYHGFAFTWWNIVFYAGAVFLAAGGLLGRAVFRSSRTRGIGLASAATLVLLAVVHVVQDVSLLHARPHCYHPLPSSDYQICSGGSGASFWMQATAFLIYSLMPPAALVCLTGAGTTIVRVWLSWHPRLHDRDTKRTAAVPDEYQFSRPERPAPEAAQEYWYQNSVIPPDREAGGTGVSLSGGGIRSATFSLGALQALQERGTGKAGTPSEFCDVRYVASVSGGSYMAAAMQFARHDLPDATSCRPLIMPGSTRCDYLRRHASYIARTADEWALAVLVVLRGALLSAFFLAALAYTAGRWAGHFYYMAGRQGVFDEPWSPAWPMIAPTVCLAALVALLWIIAVYRRGRGGDTTAAEARRGAGGRCTHVAEGLALAVGVLIVTGALVPIVVWLSVHGPWAATSTHGQVHLRTAVQGGIAGVLATTLGIVGLLSSRKTEIKTAVKQVQTGLKALQRIGDVGKRAAQWLAVYGGLAMVVIVYLKVFGVTAHASADEAPWSALRLNRGTPHLDITWMPNWLFTVLCTAVLLVLYYFVDETSLGLHTFYRDRLFAALSVPDASDGHEARAFLDDYRPVEGRFPQVIYCASAHSSDPADIQPGRGAIPFTFSHDYIGGPAGDWARVAQVRNLLNRKLERYERDLTVETAMAVSGAAFSSAMGRYSRPANVILALTNARLGTWLVNPSYIAAMQWKRADEWNLPHVPKRRRMSYLLREIFGVYPRNHPLIFVTDGGHYEYLGLTELFRHRCENIYCFDASTDRQAFAESISESIILAYDTLGVEVHLDTPDLASPNGSAGNGAAHGLSARMAQTAVITGSFTYPEDRGKKGTLVIGKATLDRTLPWELQRYAAAHPLFPYDALGDQFFGVDKFDAYTELGRHVGAQAVRAMNYQRWRNTVPPATAVGEAVRAAGKR
ncbi:hypothetical protein [Streptomyces sp. NPDC014806]|uniref:hypothetical protein n=1 Tax=Streptomyces sp. NPDC014806 TaxID=3364920 RepID=UPI0036FC3BB5